MFPRPYGENIIFLEFLGSGTQIEGGQNTVPTMVTTVRESKGALEKEIFGCF